MDGNSKPKPPPGGDGGGILGALQMALENIKKDTHSSGVYDVVEFFRNHASLC